MFKECGLIEKYGSGIGRIKKFCKMHNIIEPKFEELQKGFQVTLYKEKLTDKKTYGGVNTLLEYIIKNPHLKASNLSDGMHIPLRTRQRALKQLKDDNKIEFRGSPKTGGYVICGNNFKET